MYAIEIDVCIPRGKTEIMFMMEYWSWLFYRSILIMKSLRLLDFQNYKREKERMRGRGRKSSETLKLGESPVISQISGDVRI